MKDDSTSSESISQPRNRWSKMEVGEMNPLRRVFGIVVTNVGRIAFRVLLLLWSVIS
jgi:hypothetical protein